MTLPLIAAVPPFHHPSTYHPAGIIHYGKFCPHKISRVLTTYKTVEVIKPGMINNFLEFTLTVAFPWSQSTSNFVPFRAGLLKLFPLVTPLFA